MPLIVISGCSGGGKSALLSELARRGHAVVAEPGRRVIAAAEAEAAPHRLPWVDMAGFARAALALAEADYRAARSVRGPVFFDRGLVDAALALQWSSGDPAGLRLVRRLRYAPLVFLAPPWPLIYQQDGMRQHGFDAATAEYCRLRAGCHALGYRIALIPRMGVRARADWVLARLAQAGIGTGMKKPPARGRGLSL